MTFYLVVPIVLVRSRLLSGHPLGNNCPLGCPHVLFVLCIFVIFVISRFVLRTGFGF